MNILSIERAQASYDKIADCYQVEVIAAEGRCWLLSGLGYAGRLADRLMLCGHQDAAASIRGAIDHCRLLNEQIKVRVA